MGDGFQPHVLCRFRRQRRTPAAGAKEHEFLVLGKKRLVIRAFGVDPELQHAARDVVGAGDFALALKLAIEHREAWLLDITSGAEAATY